MTLNLVNQVATFCQNNALLSPRDKIVVGVSGGPDSLCLLHLLINLSTRFNLTLTVAHLNHKLRRTDSQADADFVQTIADQWQISLYQKSVDIAHLSTRRKQSIEECARQVRYAFLWQVAKQTNSSKIAVGHNADDQTETVLMHFLRGSGLTGLRGMLPAVNISGLRLPTNDIPPAQAHPAPKLIRPLLETSRLEIETYCRENSLSPRQDYSNQDTTYFRNRLRHDLIPYLTTYNPNIRRVLQRTAKVAAAETHFLNKHLTSIWPSVVKHESSQKIEFNLQQWLALPLAMKRSTLRRAITQLRFSLRDIGFQHIDDAIAIVEQKKTGSRATLPNQLLLTVSYNSFFIAPQNPISNAPTAEDFLILGQEQEVQVKLPGVTPLPKTRWQLKTILLPVTEIDMPAVKQALPTEAYLDAGKVGTAAILRPRQPGDTFCPLGMGGKHKKVNEFMINAKIPVGYRPYIPLLVANDQILWICGFQPDERTRLGSATRQVLYLKFETA